jgi:hypothetical protein
MKKEQFRTLVKEIIMEVISEMDEGQNSYPAGGVNDPKIDVKNKAKQDWAAKKASLDTLKNPNPSNKTPFFKGPGSVDENEEEHSEHDDPVDLRVKPTAQKDKKWRGKMRFLDKIKQEPDFQKNLNALRNRKGDEQ